MPYLSKKTEDTLFRILDWSKTEDINKIICSDENLQNLFCDFECSLIRLKQQRKADNEKIWRTIKEKRKTDKNYCR